MPSTCWSLRSASRAQEVTETAPTATPIAAQPKKGKKGASTKAPSKPQPRRVKATVQPQLQDIEVVQREKALALAEIEDKLVAEAKREKAAHPRQWALEPGLYL